MEGIETFEDLCKPETLARIKENITYLAQQQNRSIIGEQALQIFRDMLRKGETECGVVIRSIHNYKHPQPKKKPNKFDSGFRAMLDASHPQEQEKRHKPQNKVRGFGSGFGGMLDQAYKRIERQTVETKIPTGTIVDLASEFPLICDRTCPFTQCSSWGVEEMQGKPCRNHTKTNDEISVRNIHLRSFQ